MSSQSPPAHPFQLYEPGLPDEPRSPRHSSAYANLMCHTGKSIVAEYLGLSHLCISCAACGYCPTCSVISRTEMLDRKDNTKPNSTLPGISALPDGDNDQPLASSPSGPVQGGPTLRASENDHEVTSDAPSPAQGNTDGSTAHHVASLLAYIHPCHQESFTCEEYPLTVDGVSEDIPVFSLTAKDGNCLITIMDLTKVNYDLSKATTLTNKEVRPITIDIPAFVNYLK